ncbi:uncharacterized protein DUF2690 [Thermosporothrix hazakensis]|uniref:Uncharacterized protein DUF2690 n=1 Tax=Thermosporothrix hazakensis TaxID=644383 RepID=A0A326U1J0_THEHA|nr:DUF2690 domain-containing protein [Thermosporothrix hazakensis]PZW24050.1 uncharacterized protein DUF2690 [Thermosporothrix hazakensis]GCE50264.1 hypothetical protein KTH_51330 [Thermosporothrix hazakensis]
MFQKHIRPLLVALLVAFLALTLTFSSVPGAHAASLRPHLPACYNASTCDNTDPNSVQGLDGAACGSNAYTVTEKYGGGKTISLRFSRNCKTNWARFTNSLYILGWSLWVERRNANGSVTRSNVYSSWGTTGGSWSDQLYTDTLAARACVSLADGDWCTDWV